MFEIEKNDFLRRGLVVQTSLKGWSQFARLTRLCRTMTTRGFFRWRFIRLDVDLAHQYIVAIKFQSNQDYYNFLLCNNQMKSINAQSFRKNYNLMSWSLVG
jgi:hypothetical protein